MTTTEYWQNVAQEARPRLDSIAESLKSLRSGDLLSLNRVSQLDAESLDEELVKLLQEPITRAGNVINVSGWKRVRVGRRGCFECSNIVCGIEFVGVIKVDR